MVPVHGSIATKHAKAGSVDYSIVLPENYDKDRAEPYPLIISFHPAGRGSDHLIDPGGAARTGRDIIAPRDVVWAGFDNKPGGGRQQGHLPICVPRPWGPGPL